MCLGKSGMDGWIFDASGSKGRTHVRQRADMMCGEERRCVERRGEERMAEEGLAQEMC